MVFQSKHLECSHRCPLLDTRLLTCELRQSFLVTFSQLIPSNLVAARATQPVFPSDTALALDTSKFDTVVGWPNECFNNMFLSARRIRDTRVNDVKHSASSLLELVSDRWFVQASTQTIDKCFSFWSSLWTILTPQLCKLLDLRSNCATFPTNDSGETISVVLLGLVASRQ